MLLTIEKLKAIFWMMVIVEAVLVLGYFSAAAIPMLPDMLLFLSWISSGITGVLLSLNIAYRAGKETGYIRDIISFIAGMIVFLVMAFFLWFVTPFYVMLLSILIIIFTIVNVSVFKKQNEKNGKV